MQLTKVLQSQGLVVAAQAAIRVEQFLEIPSLAVHHLILLLGKVGLHSNIKWDILGAYTAPWQPHKTFIENFVSEKSPRKFQMITQKMHLLFNHNSGVQVRFNLKTKTLKLKKTFLFSSFEILHLTSLFLQFCLMLPVILEHD